MHEYGTITYFTLTLLSVCLYNAWLRRRHRGGIIAFWFSSFLRSTLPIRVCSPTWACWPTPHEHAAKHRSACQLEAKPKPNSPGPLSLSFPPSLALAWQAPPSRSLSSELVRSQVQLERRFEAFRRNDQLGRALLLRPRPRVRRVAQLPREQRPR